MSAPWLFALLAVLGVVLLALDRLALKVVRPPRRPPARTPEDLGLPFDDVVIPSEQTLRGWLVDAAPDGGERRTLLILSHGWAANAAVLLGVARDAARAGHPVLLFDFRSHGRSDDAPHVTVRHYRDDLAAVVRWARERFPDRPVVVAGHSMGGAAALLAAAEGAAVDGVAMIAGPADVLEVTAGYLSDRGLPGMLLIRLLRPFWTLRTRTANRRLVPERRVGEVGVPVLVIQPERDVRVPPEHARRLMAAGADELVVVAGADHTDVLERPETARAVLALAERVGVEETG